MKKYYKYYSVIVVIIILAFIMSQNANAMSTSKITYESSAVSHIVSIKKFQTYKVIITASKVSIRRTPSSSGKIIGSYYKNNIVDITGQSGSYLKTSKGYIWAAYTKKYIPPVQAPVKQDKYIKILENTPVFKEINGSPDERIAVTGKAYKVLDEKSGYYKIKAGRIEGYIPIEKTQLLTQVPKNKVTLSWNYIHTKSRNKEYYDTNEDYINKSSSDTGLDVISPTWFYMVGDPKDASTINVNEKADAEYSRIAHSNGYEVWAQFFEGDSNSSERFYTMISDPAARERVMAKLIEYADTFNVDGINIDFEGLGKRNENKDGFTAFVRDLSKLLKQKGITVSVDVTKPVAASYYSNFYDRPALAREVDHLIFMAYDEHTGSYYDSGSTASYGWVDQGIKDILAQGVPKEKLLLAVPFYTIDYTLVDVPQTFQQKTVVALKDTNIYKEPKLADDIKIISCLSGQSFKYINLSEDKEWYTIEYKNGDELIQAFIPNADSVAVNANTFIAGYTQIDIKTLKEKLKQYNAIVVFDEKGTKQNIAQYAVDGLKHYIWLEDETSMGWRMDLINKYDLGGMAGWRMYMETQDILDIIKMKLK